MGKPGVKILYGTDLYGKLLIFFFNHINFFLCLFVHMDVIFLYQLKISGNTGDGGFQVMKEF